MGGRAHNNRTAADEGGIAGARNRRERAIAALAARQHGVLTRRQLLAMGLGRDAVDGRVKAGRLHPLHRGVYLLGHRAPARYARELAAVLACGDEAALGHGAAASVWTMLPYRAAYRPIDVIVVTGDSRGKPGIRIHRQRLERDEVRIRHGIPLTSPARTLLDLAATSPRALERALAEAYTRHLVRRAELLALITRHPRHRGAARLRTLIETDPAFTRSEAERRFLALVRRARLPEPETNVRLGPYEVDFLWRRRRVIVEVDGYAFHSSRRSFEGDRRRDADLAARGFHVIRITWRQIVSEPEAVLARLAQALVRAKTG